MWYIGTMVTKRVVERVQTGVRMEKRLVKVLKALEGIVLHAFEGKAPFSAATLKQVADLKRIYGLDLKAGDGHRLKEGRA